MQEPDVNEMQEALKKRAELRGKVKLLDLQIKQAEIPIRKSSPRKPELRYEATQELHSEKVSYEIELEHVESTIEYLNFYLNVWRYSQYNSNRSI